MRLRLPAAGGRRRKTYAVAHPSPRLLYSRRGGNRPHGGPARPRPSGAGIRVLDLVAVIVGTDLLPAVFKFAPEPLHPPPPLGRPRALSDSSCPSVSPQTPHSLQSVTSESPTRTKCLHLERV